MALKRRRDGGKEDRSPETGTAGVEDGLLQMHGEPRSESRAIGRVAVDFKPTRDPAVHSAISLNSWSFRLPSPVNFPREPVRLLQASL